MRSTENDAGLTPFRTAFTKQFVPFLLLFCFLNTILFPSVLVLSRKATYDWGIIYNAQTSTSLTEYLLEDCLEMYDPTPDNQEEDVNNLENLYDELDLLNSVVTHAHFSFYAEKIKRHSQRYYPLLCSYCNSATPPPEYLYLQTAVPV